MNNTLRTLFKEWTTTGYQPNPIWRNFLNNYNLPTGLTHFKGYLPKHLPIKFLEDRNKIYSAFEKQQCKKNNRFCAIGYGMTNEEMHKYCIFKFLDISTLKVTDTRIEGTCKKYYKKRIFKKDIKFPELDLWIEITPKIKMPEHQKEFQKNTCFWREGHRIERVILFNKTTPFNIPSDFYDFWIEKYEMKSEYLPFILKYKNGRLYYTKNNKANWIEMPRITDTAQKENRVKALKGIKIPKEPRYAKQQLPTDSKMPGIGHLRPKLDHFQQKQWERFQKIKTAYLRPKIAENWTDQELFNLTKYSYNGLPYLQGGYNCYPEGHWIPDDWDTETEILYNKYITNWYLKNPNKIYKGIEKKYPNVLKTQTAEIEKEIELQEGKAPNLEDLDVIGDYTLYRLLANSKKLTDLYGLRYNTAALRAALSKFFRKPEEYVLKDSITKHIEKTYTTESKKYGILDILVHAYLNLAYNYYATYNKVSPKKFEDAVLILRDTSETWLKTKNQKLTKWHYLMKSSYKS